MLSEFISKLKKNRSPVEFRAALDRVKSPPVAGGIKPHRKTYNYTLTINGMRFVHKSRSPKITHVVIGRLDDETERNPFFGGARYGVLLWSRSEKNAKRFGAARFRDGMHVVPVGAMVIILETKKAV